MFGYETYIYCYFLYNVFLIINVHSEPQSCIYSCKTTYMETKQMGNSTNLAGKIEHAQFTLQDCARLPCKIARPLLYNIATCRIPCNVLQDILHAILHRVGRPLVHCYSYRNTVVRHSKFFIILIGTLLLDILSSLLFL